MFHRAARLVLVASMLGSMGVHLVFFQAVAWTRMAVIFSCHDGFGASLKKTFDGQHPCELCQKVKKASQADGSLGVLQTKNVPDALSSSLPQVAMIFCQWDLPPVLRPLHEFSAVSDTLPPIEILS